ncbi:MAG: WD40 repeat domain-containing protein, partial [Saprospiraceae bacterium]|nr:WD40 repeat domain-containing protein [Saprospiraceae bacterium]
ATGSGDSTAIIWDLASGKSVITLEGHRAGVESVCFSPDGKHLATGSEDKTARIWDLASGKSALTLEGHRGGVTGVIFSPDGNRLATSSWDNTARIWDLASGKSTLRLEGHSQFVRSVIFSPDSKRLATGSEDHTARIWDLASGKVALTLEGHRDFVSSVCFSPDGKRLATGSGDTKIWDLAPPIDFGVGGLDKRLAGLMLTQLSEYGLENLLDQQPGNEDSLVATGNTWQIAAFGDLYAAKIATTFPVKKSDYERARRLYEACLRSGIEEQYFQQKIEDLDAVWKARGE